MEIFTIRNNDSPSDEATSKNLLSGMRCQCTWKPADKYFILLTRFDEQSMAALKFISASCDAANLECFQFDVRREDNGKFFGFDENKQFEIFGVLT